MGMKATLGTITMAGALALSVACGVGSVDQNTIGDAFRGDPGTQATTAPPQVIATATPAPESVIPEDYKLVFIVHGAPGEPRPRHTYGGNDRDDYLAQRYLPLMQAEGITMAHLLDHYHGISFQMGKDRVTARLEKEYSLQDRAADSPTRWETIRGAR